MNTKLLIMGVGTLALFNAFCAGIQISNVQANQPSKDSGRVNIVFDLTADNTNKLSVILSAMNGENNQTVKMNAIYDAGGNFLGNPAKIEPGEGRHLVWNSALDLGKGFYSQNMIVTVRATAESLPLTPYQVHEVATEHCLKARDEAQKAYDAAKEATAKATQELSVANAAVAEVTDEALKAKWNAAIDVNNTARTNLAAFVAVSNMYGITKTAWDIRDGFPLAKDIYSVANWDRTRAALDDKYGVSLPPYLHTGDKALTNLYVAADQAKVMADDMVTTNRYVIYWDGDIDATKAVTKYGSAALNTYIAAEFKKRALNTTIVIEAYTNTALRTWIPVDSAGTRTREYANAERNIGINPTTGDFEPADFKQDVVNKVAAWAQGDAANLPAKMTALDTATKNMNDGFDVLKGFFDVRAEADEALTEARDNYNARKTLQAAAAANVKSCESALEDAEAVEAIAKAAYEKCTEE